MGSPEVTPKSPNYSILIVDDNAAVRRSLRRVLESHPQWEVCGEAANGCEAITKAQQLQPDLIVLDLSMPVMNGLDAAGAIKGLMPDISILMFTVCSNSQLERVATAVGVNAVSSKLEPSALLECVEKILKPAA
ncbi:MAG: hypothetical protein NVS1B11_17890 [Terriglobales bacterium]